MDNFNLKQFINENNLGAYSRLKTYENLDPVGKEDLDINNDGKVDKIDKYLANRRKSISKATSTNEAEQIDVIDTVTIDIPLFIRLLEYAKEDAQTDMDLHNLTEKAITLNKSKDILSMEDYDGLVAGQDVIPVEEPTEEMNEDLDVGHQDDEPAMLKNKMYRASKLASMLYDKLDNYDDMSTEVDFPDWWQTKISKAKDMLQSAYDYLDGEEGVAKVDQIALENKNINENISQEVVNKVSRFVTSMANYYDYSEQDAVYAIMQALKAHKANFQGLNEKKVEIDDKTEFKIKLSHLIDKHAK